MYWTCHFIFQVTRQRRTEIFDYGPSKRTIHFSCVNLTYGPSSYLHIKIPCKLLFSERLYPTGLLIIGVFQVSERQTWRLDRKQFITSSSNVFRVFLLSMVMHRLDFDHSDILKLETWFLYSGLSTVVHLDAFRFYGNELCYDGQLNSSKSCW